MYSLETLSEREGNELSAGMANAEEEIIERETIAERNKRLYAAIRTLSPRQQEVIHKVYFEEKSQRAVSKELGVSDRGVISALQYSMDFSFLSSILESSFFTAILGFSINLWRNIDLPGSELKLHVF